VQFAIANVMATTYTDNAEYYNPTLTTSIQDDQATAPYDYNDQNVGTVVTGALAASASAALSNITVSVAINASW
jgi:hypothetical protein